MIDLQDILNQLLNVLPFLLVHVFIHGQLARELPMKSTYRYPPRFRASDAQDVVHASLIQPTTFTEERGFSMKET